jgi:hypothetical protein
VILGEEAKEWMTPGEIKVEQVVHEFGVLRYAEP